MGTSLRVPSLGAAVRLGPLVHRLANRPQPRLPVLGSDKFPPGAFAIVIPANYSLVEVRRSQVLVAQLRFSSSTLRLASFDSHLFFRTSEDLPAVRLEVGMGHLYNGSE